MRQFEEWSTEGRRSPWNERSRDGFGHRRDRWRTGEVLGSAAVNDLIATTNGFRCWIFCSNGFHHGSKCFVHGRLFIVWRMGTISLFKLVHGCLMVNGWWVKVMMNWCYGGTAGEVSQNQRCFTVTNHPCWSIDGSWWTMVANIHVWLFWSMVYLCLILMMNELL